MCKVVKNGTHFSSFTGAEGIITEGLRSQWIPKGSWSWGGSVSEHLPVWKEFFSDGGNRLTADLKELLSSVGLTLPSSVTDGIQL